MRCPSSVSSLPSCWRLPALPTLLYHLYQQSLHLTSVVVTVVFTIYAFSPIATLLTVGRLSDYVGLKPVIPASLVLNAAAMALFATDVGHLILARVVRGLSVGAGFTALGAAILDTNRTRGPLLHSVFVFLGLMAGSLGSAVFVTFCACPYHGSSCSFGGCRKRRLANQEYGHRFVRVSACLR